MESWWTAYVNSNYFTQTERRKWVSYHFYPNASGIILVFYSYIFREIADFFNPCKFGWYYNPCQKCWDSSHILGNIFNKFIFKPPPQLSVDFWLSEYMWLLSTLFWGGGGWGVYCAERILKLVLIVRHIVPLMNLWPSELIYVLWRLSKWSI